MTWGIVVPQSSHISRTRTGSANEMAHQVDLRKRRSQCPLQDRTRAVSNKVQHTRPTTRAMAQHVRVRTPAKTDVDKTTTAMKIQIDLIRVACDKEYSTHQTMPATGGCAA